MTILAERIKETSTTGSTGTLSLDGAATGFRTFVTGIGTGNVASYVIVGDDASTDAGKWEIGYGTVTSGSPDTLSRTGVFASSNSGSKVNFTAGQTKHVFIGAPGTLLNSVLTCNASTARPSWLPTNAVWLDTTGDPFVFKFWDGASSISMGNVNASTNAFVPLVNGSAVAAIATLGIGNGLLNSAGNLVVSAGAGLSIDASAVKVGAGDGLAIAASSVAFSLQDIASTVSSAAASDKLAILDTSASIQAQIIISDVFKAIGGFTDASSTVSAPADVVAVLRADGTMAKAALEHVGGAPQATQAAIEAETNEDSYLPPDLIRHSPGVAKCWADFTNSTLTVNYNVTSITDTGVGNWLVNIATDMSTANYACFAIVESPDPLDELNDIRIVTIGSGTAKTAAAFQVICYDSRGAESDPVGGVHVVAFGDQ